MTRVYLSRTEFAQRIGVSPSAMSRYRLPEPDVVIGEVRGWLPATIDRWHEARPSRRALTAQATATVRDLNTDAEVTSASASEALEEMYGPDVYVLSTERVGDSTSSVRAEIAERGTTLEHGVSVIAHAYITAEGTWPDQDAR